MQADGKGSERIWKMLSKPLDGTRLGGNHEVLEKRNPLAFAHFANHPARDMVPNVMSGKNRLDVPVLKTLVLVATRAISNEEILLN
ncbi:hypothetical protein MTR67_050470 [Solanum verrucosum]|uniref:Uncharacterized protein n=1 Tax=Solanum verrucosum TaxID=315347 RepID=A0AAF0V229_SOLVR|nr:hypothetical protein MTR67_050470 [Solanum verrucosum]